jgi:hypothetical protein
MAKYVDDPDDCSGNSQSFIEGCQAYATENGNSSDSQSQDDKSDEPDADNTEPSNGEPPPDRGE